ncbi:MAG TPA: periplasmic heavy metal sensor, partial [Patescibacteria group bacterium]|nr:periplasmic heavy metal sensor [Patescibacteria group bacterium]
IGGLVLGALAYAGMYRAGTADSCCRVDDARAPELAWLKQEFHLTEAEFTRVSELHDQYLAGCAERCHQIDLKNQELASLLSQTNNVTPQIQQALSDAAQLRAQCQARMLEHFYEVSRTMPPEQGKRYLEWVQSKTLLHDTHSSMHH